MIHSPGGKVTYQVNDVYEIVNPDPIADSSTYAIDFATNHPNCKVCEWRTTGGEEIDVHINADSANVWTTATGSFGINGNVTDLTWTNNTGANVSIQILLSR